jgi:GNAT superfamily N-acetyltransferase
MSPAPRGRVGARRTQTTPEIRKASTVDGGALRRFFRDAFPGRAEFLAAHWRWLYRLGHFPGIEALVLVEQERVIGHVGVIPLKISRLGRVATAAWFVDLSILPEFQGQGHGKALTAALMAMCPDRVAFCNERSIHVIRRLGWEERHDVRVLSQPLELAGPMRRFGPVGSAVGRLLDLPWRALLRARTAGAPRLELAPLTMDAGRLAELLDDPTASGTRIVRDAEWCNWRLLENPRRHEHVLASAAGVSAVFRLVTSGGRRRAHLLLVGPGPAPARAVLVPAFARWSLEQGADVAWGVASEPDLLSACAPYFERRHPLPFVWHSDDDAVARAFASSLPVQAIDSDHDLMFP